LFINTVSFYSACCVLLTLCLQAVTEVVDWLSIETALIAFALTSSLSLTFYQSNHARAAEGSKINSSD